MRWVQSWRSGLGGCLFLSVFLVVPPQSWAETAAPTATAPCGDVLSAENQAISARGLDPREIGTVRQFYKNRGDRCAWSAAQIVSLRAILSRADDRGLNVARYHPDTLDPNHGPLSDAARDLFATAMALRYGQDMVFGQVDLAKTETDFDVPRPTDDLARQLAWTLTQPSVEPWFAGFAPSEPAYRRLEEAFQRYRARSAAPETEPIQLGPVLKLGDSDARVTSLKARLRRLGDLTGGGDAPQFDMPTRDALAAFQRRHGLPDDGRLNRETIAALNVPDRERLRQMALNLERWRYFGHVLSATRIEVNTAAATFQLIERHRVVLAMRTVVGDRRHQSPTLVSTGVDAIILNPTWYVPDSIVQKEIEPRLAREPDYLERNDMQMDDGHVHQSPGARNALGRIKFDFPSPFAVYLHDTPSHGFFARADRALSHGCIRLERPQDLALTLLAGDDNWPPARLKAAIDKGTTQKIVVPGGPQVALVYWTAFVDEDGTVEFRADPYGRDVKLQAALDHVPVPPRGSVLMADRHK